MTPRLFGTDLGLEPMILFGESVSMEVYGVPFFVVEMTCSWGFPTMGVPLVIIYLFIGFATVIVVSFLGCPHLRRPQFLSIFQSSLSS